MAATLNEEATDKQLGNGLVARPWRIKSGETLMLSIEANEKGIMSSGHRHVRCGPGREGARSIVWLESL